MRLLLAGLLLALPVTSIPAAGPPVKRADPTKAEKTIREVAGSAEYLRSVPKEFATLKAVDATHRRVTLLADGDNVTREWPLTDDAEIKIDGWWGRLDQLALGQRVWVWLKTNRKKKPVAIAMLADDTSQQDIHGTGGTVIKNEAGVLTVKPEKGPNRVLKTAGAESHQGNRKVLPGAFAPKSRVFVRASGNEAVLICDPAAFEARRQAQRQLLRKRWLTEGLPGSVSFVHVFSGEMDLIIDHEGMRWARSLKRGDKVTLPADPAISAVVKSVTPWRERTLLRLVARSQDLTDLKPGQRLALKMPAPPHDVENSKFPPDMDLPRSRAERIDWFLASIYCTCGVRGDVCTGHFYTLASCNPNGCGKPNQMRKHLAKLIDQGLTDRQIFEKLLAEEGPGLLQPHLLP
jgi:hypothetical protein